MKHAYELSKLDSREIRQKVIGKVFDPVMPQRTIAGRLAKLPDSAKLLKTLVTQNTPIGKGDGLIYFSNRLAKIGNNTKFVEFTNPPKSWIKWNHWAFSP